MVSLLVKGNTYQYVYTQLTVIVAGVLFKIVMVPDLLTGLPANAGLTDKLIGRFPEVGPFGDGQLITPSVCDEFVKQNI